MIFNIADTEFHQYDNMAFPRKPPSTSVPRKFFNLITGQDSKEKELKIPDHLSMQSISLKLYLEVQRLQLCGLQLSPSFNVADAALKIMSIFHRLYKPFVSDNISWMCIGLEKVCNEILIRISN